jgi:hypothetical protein
MTASKYILWAGGCLVFILISVTIAPEHVWGLETTQLENEAESGDSDAAYFLGVMYRTGMNVPSDCRKALKWTRQAASQGHTLAQSHLGRIYNKGCGEKVAKDPLKAYIWTALAARQGLRYAEKNLKKLEKQLHPYLIEEAQQKIQNFEPKKLD